MKDKVKENISILKLIPLIREVMRIKGWEKNVRLSEASGVDTSVISKFLNYGEISGENICKLLDKIGLIKSSSEITKCPFCDNMKKETKKAFEALKEILESKETQDQGWANVILTTIKSHKKSKKKDCGESSGTKGKKLNTKRKAM